jgi:23S rRNA (adenine-N6)-dimethyltransferase
MRLLHAQFERRPIMAARPTSTIWRTQNFLRRTSAIERLVARSELSADDVVYEIGAGTGVLTALLARRAGRVIAIEKDARLYRQLLRRFADWPNVSVRHADFLADGLPRAPFKVFANPPFDVTSAIVTKLTNAAVPPDDLFLALQSEAADRYRGRPRQTLTSLLLLPWFDGTVIHRFRREDFMPAPGVDVVMLRLRKRGPPLVGGEYRQLYRDFSVACFTAWRPSLGAALERQLGTRVARKLLSGARIDPKGRPSEVAAASWLRLFELFSHLPTAIHLRVAGADDRLSRQQRRLHKRHRSRTPRDDLTSLGGQPQAIASAFDEPFALEHVRDGPRPPIVDGALEPIHGHRAAVG